MAVEDVSLSGQPVQPSKPGRLLKPDKAKDAAEKPGASDAEIGKLAIPAGASPGEVLDIILHTPTEQLIPWEEAELPSRGAYYDWTTGVVSVRAWGAQIDKILATARLAQTGQSINMMLEHCCRFPEGFKPDQLLVGDQVFLLYYLRGITHGNIYEFIVKCTNPDCGSTGQYTADLNELAKTITWANPALGNEPFRVVLPHLSQQTGRNVDVGVRFLRVDDAQGMIRARKAQNRIAGMGTRARIRQQMSEPRSQVESVTLDDTIMQNLETIIVDVMGIADRFKIRQFVEKLHSTDLAVIREWLRDNSPGIDTQVDLNCAECSQEFRVMLPITESFFRPQDARTMRA